MSKESYIRLFVQSGMYKTLFRTGIHMVKSYRVVFYNLYDCTSLSIYCKSLDEVLEDALEPEDE